MSRSHRRAARRRDRPRMGPTRPATLVVAGLAAAALAWLAGQHRPTASMPEPALAAGGRARRSRVLEGYAALNTRARIERKPGREPVDPLPVARFVVLAKASALVGSIFARLLRRPGRLAAASSARRAATRRPAGRVGGLVGSVGLVVAALWLERACRVPERPDDETRTADDDARLGPETASRGVTGGDARPGRGYGASVRLRWARSVTGAPSNGTGGACGVRRFRSTGGATATPTDPGMTRLPQRVRRRRPAGTPTTTDTAQRRPCRRPCSTTSSTTRRTASPGRDRMAVHVVWEIVLLLARRRRGATCCIARRRRTRYAARAGARCWSPAPRSACSPSAPG